MKALYPTQHRIPLLSQLALETKIARHSRCSICSCSGLRPPNNVELILDDTQPPNESLQYLDRCQCDHDASAHGADAESLGKQEHARRGRVAVRLDELLQDAGKLLDFEYTDDDIKSLRQQMTLPLTPAFDGTFSLTPSTDKRSLSSSSSVLSDLPEQPPAKRRKISPAGEKYLLGDDDEDDEDEPLATRIPFGTANKPPEVKQRAGKSLKMKGLTAPVSVPPPTGNDQEQMNGNSAPQVKELRVKIEDQMDESQITRLVTGVTVDTSEALATTPITTKPEKISFVELRKGFIQITPVENDGQPRSRIILTGLKTLFQKQLPKMPREYIARLVFDTNSKCLAIIKFGYQVVGGICYRPFPHRDFAEIVFFATNSADQVKGYGGMLMDHFKHHIRSTYPNMMHFLTYADNYAVGYFKKQGFSKEITLPRSVWAGYIKDYEGGTIMLCTMLPKVNYLETRDIISRQREAIMTKIREKSRSHIVYPGLSQFMKTDGGELQVDYRDVPGLRESGWTPDMSNVVRSIHKSPERTIMELLLADLQGHPVAWAFLQPVNADEVPDYHDVIKEPMDFNTMEKKLDSDEYHDLEAFIADGHLVFENCRAYNPEGSVYAKNATKMEKFMKDQLASYLVKQED